MTLKKKMESHFSIPNKKKDSSPYLISSSVFLANNDHEERDCISLELMTCPTSTTTTTTSCYSSFFLVQFFSFPPLLTPFFHANEPQHFIFHWPILNLSSLLLWYLSTKAQVQIHWIQVNPKGTPIWSSLCSLPLFFDNWNSCSFSPLTLSTHLSSCFSSVSESSLSIQIQEKVLTETMPFTWKCHASPNLIASLLSMHATTSSTTLSSSLDSSSSSPLFYTLHLSLELPAMTTNALPSSTIKTSSSYSNSSFPGLAMTSSTFQWTIDFLHYRELRGHQFTLLLPENDPAILEFLKAPKFTLHGQYLPSSTLAPSTSSMSSIHLKDPLTTILVGPDLLLHPSFSLPLPSVIGPRIGGGYLHVVLNHNQPYHYLFPALCNIYEKSMKLKKNINLIKDLDK